MSPKKHKPNASGKFRQGKYKIKNVAKYMGDATEIYYRSSWELKSFEFFDSNPKVIKWGSEEIAIPYLKPYPGGFRLAKYYPDIYVEYIDRNGNYIKELLEIKPLKQTQPSKARKLSTKLYENTVYLINRIKFDAADQWCKMNGVKFTVATEKQLFG